MSVHALILLTIQATAFATPETSKFSIHVQENTARITQGIETDLYKNHVYYHTPAHNHVQETYKMQDFTTGLEVFCMPSKRHCYLTSINTQAYPNAGKLMESISHMWNMGVDSIGDNEATSIHLNYTISHEIHEMTFMGKEMRDFVQQKGYPLYKLILISEEDMLLYEQPHKRHPTEDSLISSNPSKCKDDKPMKQRYGYTGTTGCDYLYFCDTTLITDPSKMHHELVTPCPKTHVTSHIFYTCLCCPESHRVSTCYKCLKVA